MASDAVRVLDVTELCSDMRPPTDDEVPTGLDGTRLDSKEKLVAHLDEISERRRRSLVD